MKTDVIIVTPKGEGVAEAIAQTERAAAFRGLERKQTMHLCLLAEEVTGMLKTIVGPTELRYWVESEGKDFSLHVAADVQVDPDMRKELLKVSSKRENAAAKGFMGRVRDVFTRLFASSDNVPLATEYGYAYVDVVGYDASVDMSPNAMLYGWSLKAYRDAVKEHRAEESEKWDELEKSITAKLADDVQVFIRMNTVELVIKKAF